MSWLPDPHQLAELPTVEEEIIEDDGPPTPEEIFYGSIRFYPDSVGSDPGIHVDVCHFDEEGNHTAMAKNCPHYEAEDETGPRISKGWTVQSGK